MTSTTGSHGVAGQREAAFTRLFPRRISGFNAQDLQILAKAMIGNQGDKPSNEPDGEENLLVPAGYTYFGQFIDHDLTFDTTSSLLDAKAVASNLRTPRLDLDCVYGSGPDDQPYLYATRDDSAAGVRKGASLVLGRVLAGSPNRHDLLRLDDSEEARAVVGDPRNDENSIVCNIQAAFIQFHNTVVAKLSSEQPQLSAGELFHKARKLVRWTYQRIVAEDYLPRIIEPATYQTFKHRLDTQGEGAFKLFTASLRSGIPIEFAGAAYRYGHSMVRTGYKLNDAHDPQFIFTPGKGINSLVGFGKLSDKHWIEWKRFFPEANFFKAGQRPDHNNNVADDRLQWAYRIDTSLVDPLRVLPQVISEGNSLADLNLQRGDIFGLVSGQVVANALGVAPLDKKYLVVRDKTDGDYGYTSIPASLVGDTPLWYYVLAEAQRELVDSWYAKNGGKAGPLPLDEEDLLSGVQDAEGTRKRAPAAQLGPVGGMILLETFFGLLLADRDSYLSISSDADRDDYNKWFSSFTSNGAVDVSMWQLLAFAKLT